MRRLSLHLGTVVLLLVISLPAVLVVVASYVGASDVQQVMLSTSFPHRRR